MIDPGGGGPGEAGDPTAQLTLHFELGAGGPYTLKTFGGSYPLTPHSPASRRLAPELSAEDSAAVTHFALVEAPPAARVGLHRVYGPADADGIPSLESMAVATPSTAAVQTTADLAKAILFLHPSLTVLSPDHAEIVLGHIGASDGFAALAWQLDGLRRGSKPWNTPVKVIGDGGAPVRDSRGQIMYEYVLDPTIENHRTTVARHASIAVNGDESLRGIRWAVKDGVPFRVRTPAAPEATAAAGYRFALQDPGPHYGIAAEVLGVDDDLTLTFELSNSYIRYASVCVSFIGGDGKTAIAIDDAAWLKLLGDELRAIVELWLEVVTGHSSELGWDATTTLLAVGILSPEITFLGVPVQAGSGRYSFQLPSVGDTPGGAHTISKVRILCGSLGTPSGNDWDPQAAWLGIGLTALLNLVVPTASLLAGVGMTTDKATDIITDWQFLVTTAGEIALAIWDSVKNPDRTGEDLRAFFTWLADTLVKNVLSATDVAAKLAFYFGIEEAVEAIPLIGWALKAEAIEATIEQLAQTVGEIAASPRVVEFNVTLSMSVELTIRPAGASGFPATATSYTITAQYSDLTACVFTEDLVDQNVSALQRRWDDMPIGGEVQFLVAFSSKEGWLVGAGQSDKMANRVTSGEGALVVPAITIAEYLYPLDAQTTYGHSHRLRYDGGSHGWQKTAEAPRETREQLGAGGGGHVLADVSGITLNNDLAILGYSWQASGQDVPAFGTTDPRDASVYTFQTVSFGPDAESALCFTPTGFVVSPELAFIRSATGENPLAGRGFFFVDPVEDGDGGYHLRGITPVTHSSTPPDQRRFALSRENSFGRFHILPTSVSVHPNGCIVAAASGTSKLQLLELPDMAGPSGEARWANLLCGPGAREGLLDSPEVVAIVPDQTILVLEAGNDRVQAFSRGGHPVRRFAGPTPYWFPLHHEAGESTTVTYTSMSVEIKGHVYVLSYEDDGYEADQFRLDVYTPEGAHLFRQRGLNVGALTVDLWRNVFTENFQTILGPAQRTEPSVSRWIPATPRNPR